MEETCSADRQRYYRKNIERMARVMSITDEEMAKGFRNYKVRELSRLLTIASDFWSRESCLIKRISVSDREARLQFDCRVPAELVALGIYVDFETGRIGRKAIKRCHKCRDSNCEDKKKRVRDWKHEEVDAEIHQRSEVDKVRKCKEPQLSKGYKEPQRLRKEQKQKRRDSKEGDRRDSKEGDRREEMRKSKRGEKKESKSKESTESRKSRWESSWEKKGDEWSSERGVKWREERDDEWRESEMPRNQENIPNKSTSAILPWYPEEAAYDYLWWKQIPGRNNTKF